MWNAVYRSNKLFTRITAPFDVFCVDIVPRTPSPVLYLTFHPKFTWNCLCSLSWRPLYINWYLIFPSGLTSVLRNPFLP